ncbi:DUF6773 family protein [Butyricicoccus sp.]|uniref:DUF6773 family protein n=1 Tax=Butyricicoccus sp. TaxID=2049021 RepID=UPI003F145FBB
MKRMKNNLDERQEQELLHIEHIGVWFCFWALFAALVIQLLMGAPWSQIAGEWVIFMVLSLGTAIACIRRGIWDRHLKPDLKTNVAASAVGGLAVTVFMFGMMLRNTDGEFFGISIVLAVGTGLITFAMCLVLLTIFARLTKKRQQKLDNMDCEDDDE